MSASLFSLTGKVALITGATNGIGQGMAQGLVELDLKQLIIVHRPTTDPTSTIQLLKLINSAVVISTIPIDLSDTKISQLEEVIVKPLIIQSCTGHIDILINNAGITYRENFESFPDDEFDNVLHTNMRVPVKLSQLVGKHMLDNSVRGKIIFTASLMSYQGGVLVTPYLIAKGALKTFIMAVSNEWSKHGINVNGIAPGYIKTNMTHSLGEDELRNRQISERIPMGRWGSPEDFKGPVVFLLSLLSEYVSGELLVVDGGWMGR